MSSIKSLCVYCSSANVAPVYQAAARELGARCAAQGITIVYGGGRVGLMGIVADAALAASGKVIGVIPYFLKDKEISHAELSELHITKTLQERQTLMAEMADGFIALPGGLGTLAELFEILTWKQLGLYQKPVALYEVAGYWKPLQEFLDQAQKQGFIRENMTALLKPFNNWDEYFISIK